MSTVILLNTATHTPPPAPVYVPTGGETELFEAFLQNIKTALVECARKGKFDTQRMPSLIKVEGQIATPDRLPSLRISLARENEKDGALYPSDMDYDYMAQLHNEALPFLEGIACNFESWEDGRAITLVAQQKGKSFEDLFRILEKAEWMGDLRYPAALKAQERWTQHVTTATR